MAVWICLLRGINVGGKTSMRMAQLKELLHGNGLAEVQTYIQSGNLVFRAEGEANALEKKIGDAIEADCAFRPKVLVMEADTLRRIAAENPFPEAEAEHKSLHVFFLMGRAEKADIAAMENLKSVSESFVLKQHAFYLHAPDGIGRSKLAEKTEKLLGVPVTARNWRTVSALLAMAASL